MPETLPLFSKEEDSFDPATLEINLQKMLHLLLYIDKHQHCEGVKKKPEQQSWKILNEYIDELIRAALLKERSRTPKNVSFSLGKDLLREKDKTFASLQARFGPGPFHIFEKTRRGAERVFTETMNATSERGICLLRPRDASSTPEWFMHLPACFDAALDMQLLERRKNKVPFLIWTQGNNFGFSQGDIIYRNPFTGSGNAPLLQIDSASSAGLGESGKRSPGHVRFTWHFTGDDTTREMTQDEFVRLLISGE